MPDFKSKFWYRYTLNGSRKKYIGQCVSISNNFIIFRMGFENKEDLTVEKLHMVDIKIIKSFENVSPRYITSKTIGKIEKYVVDMD